MKLRPLAKIADWIKIMILSHILKISISLLAIVNIIFAASSSNEVATYMGMDLSSINFERLKMVDGARVYNEYGESRLEIIKKYQNGPVFQQILKGGIVVSSLEFKNTNEFELYKKREATNALLKLDRIIKVNSAIDWLVNQGADINASDIKGNTPLMLALQAFFIEPASINTLLKMGARINARNSENKTALFFAIRNGRSNFEIVKILVMGGADVNEVYPDSSTPLICAADEYDPNPDIVKLLIAKGANINSRDHDGKSAFYHIISGYTKNNKAQIEILRILLSNSTLKKLEPKDGIPLIDIAISLHCVSECNPEVINILIENNADIRSNNSIGFSPLLCESINQICIECARLLIHKGANINDHDTAGVTPLMLAADGGNIGNMTLLLQNGADIKAKDKNGKTAYDYAKANWGIADSAIVNKLK